MLLCTTDITYHMFISTGSPCHLDDGSLCPREDTAISQFTLRHRFETHSRSVGTELTPADNATRLWLISPIIRGGSLSHRQRPRHYLGCMTNPVIYPLAVLIFIWSESTKSKIIVSGTPFPTPTPTHFPRAFFERNPKTLCLLVSNFLMAILGISLTIKNCLKIIGLATIIKIKIIQHQLFTISLAPSKHSGRGRV